MVKTAIILLSGGLDSATVLAQAAAQGYKIYALSFAYGQRHTVELDAARRIIACSHGAVLEHKIVTIDLATFGGSALTDTSIPVPDFTPESQNPGSIEHSAASASSPAATTIPLTYVPARNTIFLSYALAFAEVRRTFDIFIGVNAVDYSGYPDCRPEYIDKFAELANLATAIGVESHSSQHRRIKIHAPLIQMSKAEIIAAGLKLGVDYGLTVSCYNPIVDAASSSAAANADNTAPIQQSHHTATRPPSPLACGQCDACVLRLRGFAANDIPDPARYVAGLHPVS